MQVSRRGVFPVFARPIQNLAVLPFMFLLPSLLFHLCFLVLPLNTIKVIDNPGLWFIMGGLALDFGG